MNMSTNKESFLEVLKAHQGIIFKICHSYCKDPEDQKDLVQEVIIQLWNNFHKYDPQFKYSTWIYRIALNVAISFYRKTSNRLRHEQGFADHFLEINEADVQEDQKRFQLLHQFIDRLDEMNKALMILYLDGNTHEEIAEVLGISVSNVGTRISRVKQKMKKSFQKY